MPDSERPPGGGSGRRTGSGGAGGGRGGGSGRGRSGPGALGRAGGRERVRTARGRDAGSTRWIQRQLDDPYVRAAKAEGWRSRAAFKLIELDERFGLLAGVTRVVDLGAAPGGWSQVAAARRPGARVVALDILPIAPLDGVTVLDADIRDPATPRRVAEALGGPADLVLSDMAANTVGHARTDHLRTMALVESALDLAEELLAPGGSFVAKVLAGGADPQLVARLKAGFAEVKHAKPPASRKESREWYVVAKGWKAPSGETGPGPAAAP